MRLLLALLLGCSSITVAAESQIYGELQFGAHGVQHSDLDFYPGFASGSVGVYVWPRIGIELFADRGFNSDREGDFEAEVTEASGIAVRLESTPLDDLRAYVLLGYVTYVIHQFEYSGETRRRDKEDFAGARVSVGLAKQIRHKPNLQFLFEYRNYDIDGPLNVDGLSLGLRMVLK